MTASNRIPTPGVAPPFTLRLFGSFEARLGGEPLPPLHSRKGHWLLALLVLRGTDLDRSWLAGTLWPESSEPVGLKNLRNCLNDLRRALGPQASRLRSPTLRTLSLDVADAAVDVAIFDKAVAHGEQGALARAIALYRGPLLEGCAEAWVLPEREAREQAYLGALETLAAAALKSGEPGTAERYLRQAVAIDPLRESAQRTLMQALAAGGNYAAALLAYRELRLLLHREVNAEPDGETTALFQQLRAEARGKADGASGQRGAHAEQGSLPAGTITFLFTDIEGSTRLWEQHPKAMQTAVARHDALAAAVIAPHRGVLVKSRGEGDSLFAVFASAVDAVAAACDLQHALVAEAWPTPTPLRARIALHTGEADLREGDYYGTPINRCARLRSAAHGGQVLLSQTTCDLVRDHLPRGASLRDLGRHRLKDLQQPEQIYCLLHPALPSDFPPLRSLEAFAHNLPAQVTRFIGREQAMAQVKQLLATTRLLTLTGSGGCGKTRLALQIAADLLEEYADGVWLVELAPLADPTLVPQTVASALGVRGEPGRPLTATLTDYLRPKSLLLVLDNCEHLLAASAQLADALLRSCPSLRMLASSREGLGIGGEQTYRVPSLALPDARHLPPLERLHEFEAVQLFADRARLSQASFAVTEANAPSVASVCQRLDGIPLAIELAAARVKALPVEKLNERLDDMFRLLTGGSRTALPRQQTLRALIDWSYDLLSPSAKALLRRLSVFAGGWTLEAAEAVCVGEAVEEWEVLDLLTSLVEKSLVLYEEREGEGRYCLLETVRQYARDRLLETGVAEPVQGRHRDWFLALAEQAEPELEGAEQIVWLDRLETEHDNLRAALAWSEARGQAEAGLRLGGALRWFWGLRGYHTEGWKHLERLLALPGAEARTAVRAKALLGVESSAESQMEAGTRRARLEESLAISREIGDKRGIATPLRRLAWAATDQRDFEAARTRFEESLAILRELGDKHGIAELLQCFGWTVYLQGDTGAARVLLEEGLAVSREIGERFNAAWNLDGLGHVARDQGDYTTARTMFEEMLTLFRQLGSKVNILWSLGLLEEVAHAQGDYAAARALIEESLAISRELGDEAVIAGSLGSLAQVTQAQGDHEKARALLEEAQALGRELGDKQHRLLEWGGHLVSWGISAHGLSSQGHLLLEWGDLAGARSAFEEGLALRRAADARWAIAWALLEVGHTAWLQGEPGVTQSHAREALALFQETGNKEGLLAALESLAVAALAQERKERAARLFGAAEALGEGLRLPGHAWWRRPHERIGEAVRAASLQETFAAAWAAGRTLSLEEAVRFASEETASSGEAG